MNNRGSTTIEAALILPFILFIFATLIYLSHINYVENMIHANMILSAHEISTSALVLDELDVVDDLQSKYQKTDETIGEAYTNYINLSTGTFKKDKLSSSFNDTKKIFSDIKDLKNEEDIDEFTKTSIGIIEEFSELKSQISTDIISIVDTTKFFIENDKTLLLDGAISTSVCYIDELIAKNYLMTKFDSIVSKDDLENLNIKDLRVINARYMIPDDSLEFTYTYSISIPFITKIFDKKHKINRSFTVRAYTGSYDSRDVKSKKKKNNKNYVYIANSSKFNSCYHCYSCLRKPLEECNIFESLSRDRCKYCQDHYMITNKGYFVSGNSKIHLSDKCPKIYSKSIKRMTEEEAKRLGYRACMKRGCTGGK